MQRFRELTPIDQKTSHALYLLKAFAILSAVCAHCTGQKFLGAQILRGMFGTIGVPIFMIVSGFLFKPDEPAKLFWVKKFRSLIVPWLVWSGLVYLASCLLGIVSPSLSYFLGWVLGHESYLYFVPVLLSCFLIFRIFKAQCTIWISMVVTALSIIASCADLWPFSHVVTNYQNVLNWVGFFGLGLLLRQIGMQTVYGQIFRFRFLLLALWGITAGLYGAFFKAGYWSPLSLPFELLCFCVLLWLAMKLGHRPVLQQIGKYTYPIYLTHMFFGIGIVNRLFMDRLRPVLGIGEYPMLILQPLSIVLLSLGLFQIGVFLAKKLKLTRILWIFGL